MQPLLPDVPRKDEMTETIVNQCTISPRFSRLVQILLYTLCLSLGHGLMAQTQGSISGTVMDSTKGVLRAVKVAATEDATGLSQSVETNAVGLYRFPLLAPGSYTLTFDLAGFEEVVVHASVRVSETNSSGW
jgi:hypothetical protein